MRRMSRRMILLCLLIAPGAVAHAAGAGEQDFSMGETLLRNKKYTEARTLLEAGIQKDPSSVQAHVNLAETCRSLEAWACAEEHYETALHLDAKSGATGSMQPRLRKATVWRSLEEVTAWRLLNDAKGLMSSGKVSPEKMRQVEEALDSANELSLNNDQLALYQQLQMKLPRQRAFAVSNKPALGGVSAGGVQAETQDIPMVLIPAGEFTMGSAV